MSNSIRLFAIAALVFGATFLLFRRTIEFGFLDYDDPDFVTNNAHVLGGLTARNVAWAFRSAGSAANWQPVTWLSLMADAETWGASAAGFHLTNVLWHSLNAALAFLLLRELLRATGVALVGALVFAWHPLRVESVAWIAERKDVVSVAFALLALWAYAYGARCRIERGADFRWRTWYWLSFVAYVVGLLSKPMLVTLPALLLLLDFGIGRSAAGASLHARAPAWRRILREKIPFAIAGSACALTTFVVQRHAGALHNEFGMPHRLGNAVLSIGRYLLKMAWPVDLSVAYPHERPLPLGLVAVSLSGIAIISWTAVRTRRTHPWMIVGWTWFVVALLPVLGLVQVGPQAMADRYTYLPVIGLELAILGCWPVLVRFRAVAVMLIAAGVTIALGIKTRTELTPWRSSDALFAHALAINPRNYIALACRATTLLNDGQFVAARTAAEAALRENPDYAAARLIQGALAEGRGDLDAAAGAYRVALQSSPRYAPLHARLGAVLLHRGEYDAALTEFDQARSLRSDAAPALLGRAFALSHLQRNAEAARAFEECVAIAPDYAQAQLGYANFLVTQGRNGDAWPQFAQAVRLQPRSASAHFQFALSLADGGQVARAIEHFRAATSLQPDDVDYRRGYEQAVDQLRRPGPRISSVP